MPDEPDSRAAGGDNERQATAGEQLRAARERQGLALHQIAEDLRLDASVLEALERDDYDALGAPVFAKGHLRRYAGLLGVPTDELLVSYYQTRSSPQGPPPPVSGTLLTEGEGEREQRSGVKPAAIRVGLLLGAVALVWWILWPSPDAEDSTTVPVPLPDVTEPTPQVPQPQPVPQPVATEQPAVNVDIPVAEPELVSVPVPVPVPVPGPVPAEVAVPAAGPESEMAPVLGVAPQVELRLSFAADSWVEVYDAADNRLLFGNGRANSTRTVSGAAPLRVFLGFAIAVSAEVDGGPYEIPTPRRNNTVRFFVDAP